MRQLFTARFLHRCAVTVMSCLLFVPVAFAEKVFRFANDGDLGSLDPHLISTTAENRALYDIFLGLVTEASDGQAVPGAAESWSVSADGLIYTFKIRPHLWSDGIPVTAEDFVYSFRRLLAPETASPSAVQLYTLKNAQAVNEGKVAGNALGAKAIDPMTLELTLEYPAPYFLNQLMHRSALPVPGHVIEKFGKEWARPEHYVGNGPFNLFSFSPNDRLVLVKNPRFYDADAVRLDRVIFYAVEDLGEQVKLFRAGDVDATASIAPEQLEWLRKNMPDETRVTPTLGINYYAMSLSKKPFDDVRVRQALSMTIDRDMLSEKVMKIGEVPAYSHAPPGIGDYGDPGGPEWKDWPMEKRVTEARRLLAEAGYGPDNPLTFELRYNTSEEHKRRAVAIVAMWKQALGVQVSLFNVELKVHYADLRARAFEMARAGWGGDYADPQTLLFLYQSSTGPLNFSGYANPDFDAVMEQSNRTLDPVRRSEYLHQAEALLARDQPTIPLAYYVARHLVSKKVRGWDFNILDQHRLRWLDFENE